MSKHKPEAAKTPSAKLREFEPTDQRDAVLGVLQQFDGKPLTKRILPKLVEVGVIDPHIRKEYGSTHLEWGRYGYGWPHAELDSGSLHMYYAETSEPIDVAWVLENNKAYYQCRDERNAQRTALLTNGVAKELDEAHAALLRALTDYRHLVRVHSTHRVHVYEERLNG